MDLGFYGRLARRIESTSKYQPLWFPKKPPVRYLDDDTLLVELESALRAIRKHTIVK